MDSNQLRREQMSQELARKHEAAKLHSTRLFIVLQSFSEYRRDTQLQIALNAMHLALVHIAHHKQSVQFDSKFEAIIDWAYAISSASILALKEAEREALYYKSLGVLEALEPVCDVIIDESIDYLLKLNEESVSYAIANAYCNVLTKFMKHTSPDILVRIVHHSILLTQQCRAANVGVGTRKALMDAIMAAGNVLKEASDSVFKRIDEGSLMVVDGKITDSTAPFDDDDAGENDKRQMNATLKHDSTCTEISPLRPRDFLYLSKKMEYRPDLYPELVRKHGFRIDQLDEPRVSAFLSEQLLLTYYSDIGKRVCSQLGLEVTSEQMWNIAKLNLQPDEGVALTAQERIIAVQLFFHALKDEDDGAQSDEEILEWAQRMVSCHIRGTTTLQKIGRWFTG